MSSLSKEDTASKKYLDHLKKDLLDKLVSKEDLKNLREEFLSKLATRGAVEVVARHVLQNTKDISEIKIVLKNINWKIDDMREEITSKFDAVLTGLDKISGEISNNILVKDCFVMSCL